MDSTHATVAVGVTSATDALTTLLTGFQGMDGAHAAAAAWLVVMAATGAYAVGQTIFNRVWPPAAH